MTVRTFAERDLAPALRLTNHFIEHTAVHFGLAPMTGAELDAQWRAGREQFPWLAAEIPGTGEPERGGPVFAGFAKAGTWRAREAYRLTAEVTVYIDPRFHRRGLGRALYTELFSRLKAAGFHTAVGGITLPNDGSIALHESVGFRHVGTFREVGRKFERWHDTSWWQVMLG